MTLCCVKLFFRPAVSPGKENTDSNSTQDDKKPSGSSSPEVIKAQDKAVDVVQAKETDVAVEEEGSPIKRAASKRTRRCISSDESDEGDLHSITFRVSRFSCNVVEPLYVYAHTCLIALQRIHRTVFLLKS